MSKPFKAIVGLGNPGQRYEHTRHNAGYWLAERIARERSGTWRTEARFFGQTCECVIGGHRLRLLKPATFMNESGRAVGALVRYYDIAVDELLVAHDEIDLPPGVTRLKRGGGHGGHNGLRDVIASLASRDFSRVRIGIGHPGTKDQVTSYVLARARSEERRDIDLSLDELMSSLDELAQGRVEKVMNALHRRLVDEGRVE